MMSKEAGRYEYSPIGHFGAWRALSVCLLTAFVGHYAIATGVANELIGECGPESSFCLLRRLYVVMLDFVMLVHCFRWPASVSSMAWYVIVRNLSTKTARFLSQDGTFCEPRRIIVASTM